MQTLSYTFQYGKLDWLLDGEKVSFSQLKDFNYYISSDNYNELKNKANKESNKNVSRTIISLLNLIYDFRLTKNYVSHCTFNIIKPTNVTQEMLHELNIIMKSVPEKTNIDHFIKNVLQEHISNNNDNNIVNHSLEHAFSEIFGTEQYSVIDRVCFIKLLTQYDLFVQYKTYPFFETIVSIYTDIVRQARTLRV